jgi:hypothetical protein
MCMGKNTTVSWNHSISQFWQKLQTVWQVLFYSPSQALTNCYLVCMISMMRACLLHVWIITLTDSDIVLCPVHGCCMAREWTQNAIIKAPLGHLEQLGDMTAPDASSRSRWFQESARVVIAFLSMGRAEARRSNTSPPTPSPASRPPPDRTKGWKIKVIILCG